MTPDDADRDRTIAAMLLADLAILGSILSCSGC